MRFSNVNLRSVLKTIWLGRISYADGLTAQKCYFDKVLHARENSGNLRNYLLLLEHNPVYTVGLRSHFYSEKEELYLKSLGADFYRTDRGGLITFHGPGQLIAYPILDLSSLFVPGSNESPRVGVRRFVFLMEEAILNALREYGLFTATRSENTGIWVDKGSRKIASIGIKVKQGITSHGLALNCNTDLQWFKKIVPCGLVGKEVTSISLELKKNVSVYELVRPLCESFAHVYNLSLELPHIHVDKKE